MNMRRSVARLKGLGFILWHARHEFYHVLWGLVWAWFLRELWQEFNTRWIWLSVFGSLLPDADHLLYFFTYGKTNPYSRAAKEFFKTRQWRTLTTFIENGHKYQTELASHNFYFMAILFLLAFGSLFYEWRTGVILFGAMLLHYFFDVFDDVVTLGSLNPNWKRLRVSNKRVNK